MPKSKPQSLADANKEFKSKQRAIGRSVDKHGRVMTKDPYKDVPMNEFWKTIDREQMFDALKDSGDEAAVSLAHYLLNPDYKGSLARACRECKVTLQQLNDLWRKHNLAVGLIGVSARLPKVMEDTAVDAESRYEVCDRCDGLGTVLRSRIIDDQMVEGEESCPRCKGSREIRVAGDSKARDQVFEMVGLTGKSQGPLVAIQQNLISDNLEDTLNIAQKLLQQPAKGDR